MNNGRFKIIKGFLTDYAVWYPKAINFLKSLSDAMAAFISEGLIQSLSLFVAWIFSIIIEIHRIEAGMLNLTNNLFVVTLFSYFLPITLQLVQHMIATEQIEKNEYVEYKSVWNLRHTFQYISYKLGFTKEERTVRLQPLKNVRFLIVLSILLLAFYGVAHEQIMAASVNGSGNPIPWQESIPIILNSPFDVMVEWAAIIITTLSAVVFEVTISHYVAIRSHNIITALRAEGDKKLLQRNNANVKRFADLRKHGDGLTHKNNAWLYNNAEYENIGDSDLVDLTNGYFKLFDITTREWSEAYSNIKEFREYLKSVSNGRA